MNLYIKKAFIKGRGLFGTPPLSQDLQNYRTVQEYFFDPKLLNDGAPPNDRGCYACGKVAIKWKPISTDPSTRLAT